jgi:hypothetical protein
MDHLVRLYLEDQRRKLERKQLRTMARELREVQNAARPMIEEFNRLERERRSKGDGFIIVDANK